jgi:putative ABC transport system ATP-binding protein
MALLSITNLVKRLGRGGETFTLRVPDFAMEHGAELALTGESGSGKTTLLHLIAGIIAADEGSIVIDGTDITARSEAERDRFRADTVGVVYQTFNLLQGFSAKENVMLGAAFARHHTRTSGGSSVERRAEELLTRLGLQSAMNRKPRELSVGQQQRVAVARALIGKPKLLLADEPTANVDAANVARVMEELRSLAQADGTALLVITHDKAVEQMVSRSVPLADIVERSTA